MNCLKLHQMCYYMLMCVLFCTANSYSSTAQSTNKNNIDTSFDWDAWDVAMAKFDTIRASNPEILESDFMLAGDDKKALEQLVADRKAWLVKNPDTIPIDFIKMTLWDKDEFQQYIDKRTSWLKKHPQFLAEDFDNISHWDDDLLKGFLEKRNTWLSKNPGKRPKEYDDIWSNEDRAIWNAQRSKK